MNNGFKTVINYVKNLFPGCAPVVVSDNPQLDAQVIAYIAGNKFYTVASNGHRYWYCFVDADNIPVAKYILRSNGVNVSEHSSRYFLGREQVLRVRTVNLAQVPSGQAVVDSVMKVDSMMLSDVLVKTRSEQIRQKMK